MAGYPVRRRGGGGGGPCGQKMAAALPVRRRLTGFVSPLSLSLRNVFSSHGGNFSPPSKFVARPSVRAADIRKQLTLSVAALPLCRSPVRAKSCFLLPRLLLLASPPPSITAFRAAATLGRGFVALRSIFRLWFEGAPFSAAPAPDGVTVCHYLRLPETVSPSFGFFGPSDRRRRRSPIPGKHR